MNIKFILVQTSHAGNIGSAARAIKVMGFKDLVLVSPRCLIDEQQAISMASGAQDVLENAKIYTSLSEAIANSSINIALSARKREYSPPIINSQDIYEYINSQKANTNICNIIFGNEQFGLNNEDIMLCSHLVRIDANPLYSSLNLSQAVQIIAYELSKLSLTTPLNALKTYPKHKFATHKQIHSMHQHFLQALEHIDFYNPLVPKKLSQRLQQLWLKSNLNNEEVNILRGIAKSILNKK